MAQDEYFSFGDEDLDGELDFSDFEEDSSDLALAVAERPQETFAGESGFESAAKRAARPRGDSEKGSSERRLPSSRRTRLFVALTLGVLGLLFARVAISALDGGTSGGQEHRIATEVRPAAPSSANRSAQERAEAIRANHERAAERQRVRQHRAQTRRHARRRRERAAAERRQHAKERQAQEAEQEAAAPAPEASAPEYVPPPYEPAPPASSPEPEAPPAPPSGDHIHNGSSSQEFGL
jgi:hypothetical protein